MRRLMMVNEKANEMKKLVLAAALAALSIGQAYACNVGPFAANPAGCGVYAAPNYGAMLSQNPPAYVAPQQTPLPSMEFGSVNGHPYVINRLPGWTDIEVQQ